MFELRTLGSVSLRDSSNTPALRVQAKRIAVLVYLALAESGGVRRRDQLLAYFWPASNTVHARGALRQAVHALRSTLGDSSIMSVGDETLGVSASNLWCDVHEFTQAATAGDHLRALALYAGDFLDGFHISGVAPEFEEWVAERRRALRQLAAVCAWSAAECKRDEGDHVAGAELARRAAGYASGDEVAASRLMIFLDAIGDRAGALAVYDDVVRWVRNDYDAEPAPETMQLAARIRARTIAAPQLIASARPLGSADISVAPDALIDVADAPQPVTAGSAGGNEVRLAARHRRTMRSTVALVIVIFGVVIVPRFVRTQSDTSWPTARGVTPARPTTGTTHTALAQASVRQYERGRYYLGRRGADLFTAITYFRSALQIEPLFAPAWSGLGDAYIQLGYASTIAATDAFPKAREAAERAIALDSTLAEPHATLALVHMYYDWNWKLAEREFNRALLLNPQYATAHEWYGLFLTAMGRFDEAGEHERRAEQLDPLAPGTAATAAWVQYYSGQRVSAARGLDIVLRDHPTFALAHLYRGRVAEAQGDTSIALREYAATGPMNTTAVVIAARGHLLAEMGHARDARRILTQLDTLSRSIYVTSYGVAIVYAGLGERDSAFVWLDRAVRERTHWLVWLNRDPRWGSLRTDARFRRLTLALSLPD
jgi:DNA-binding SARP family transcriptional activator